MNPTTLRGEEKNKTHNMLKECANTAAGSAGGDGCRAAREAAADAERAAAAADEGAPREAACSHQPRHHCCASRHAHHAR